MKKIKKMHEFMAAEMTDWETGWSTADYFRTAMGGSEFFEPGILYKRMLQSEKPGNTGMTTEFPPFEEER